MTGWLHVMTLLLYGTAGGCMGVSFARNAQRWAVAALVLLGVGVATHAATLVAYMAVFGELPLVGLGPSLSTLAWLVGIGTLIAATLGRGDHIGLVLIPMVALLLAIALAAGVEPSGEATTFGRQWFRLHVLLAFVGYVGLTIAFAAGLMYLLQFKQLKSKTFGAVFRFFPPLETLDRIGRLALLTGFPFLTTALLVGWAWTARFQGVPAPENPKLIWALFSWVVFVAALAAHLGRGRKAYRGALASVAGYLLVVGIYFFIRLQSENGGAFL